MYLIVLDLRRCMRELWMIALGVGIVLLFRHGTSARREVLYLPVEVMSGQRNSGCLILLAMVGIAFLFLLLAQH